MTDAPKTDKPAAPPCGLYLRIPANPDMEEWQPRILAFQFAIKNANKYARNMHVVECELPEDASMDEVQKATAFVQVAKMNGLVVIIRGIADWAKLLEADGVLLNHVEEIAAAKEALGEDKIIGLSCGVNRNLMSEALEQGVDYITLGSAPISPDVKLLTEWTTKTSAPVAVLGPLSNDNADIYAIAGATFLDITNYLTTLEKGPIQATVNMLHAIDLAFEGGMPN